ncbi:transcriptional regulator NrdR [bacterium]|nr:transcriptional repressor NrdR [Chloroflexi bacterium CFX6]RIL11698.1 MAG: transcriptional regulator NrdR [bacterium]
MKCPYCQGSSHVVDTREVAVAIRRRRECEDCRQRFTTYERIAAANLKVVKSDGRREDFNRDKLVTGLQLACVKRPISADTIDEIASDIEGQLYRLGRNEVPSAVIGEMVMDALRDVDDVAYVRFASVYRHFTDLEVLAEEIDRLRAVKEQAESRKRQMALEL